MQIDQAKSKIEQREFSRDIALKQEARAESAAQRAEAREDRMEASQQAGLSLARQRFEFDKEKFASQQEQKRYNRVRDAFQQFGAAIAGSFRGANIGVSVPAQGGQNAGAFRINPAPQRTRPGG